MRCPKCGSKMKKAGRIGFAVIYVCPKCNWKIGKELQKMKKCNDSEIFGSCKGKTHNYAYGAVLCKYYVNGFCIHPSPKYGKELLRKNEG